MVDWDRVKNLTDFLTKVIVLVRTSQAFNTVIGHKWI